ncbi:MAG: response regulator transcription factor [Gammaproteobacteria bacterium]|jgi:FixJ family two-component response regulator|nr:response regulator transcription factor [Gammaproteobacteria bacterium]MBT3723141.1 response regulator transcription factor [Gammaproteobacteria bacterium]MBT4078694.1 response regulator transcription factor [Gammaproteobacteria bacterium]MBT4196165.1 response regulator transcription factor [Gammaproteobacteria bacterium]MBT4448292.1 response regulator transcription factor [Gammaproteobacteria bacterium]
MTGLVYVVDDDALLRHSLTGILSDAGFKTIEFSSAELFLEHPVSYKPGCILLDVKMHGMSGFDMQEKLLQRDFVPPIIFLTGSSRLEKAVDAMRAGASHFLLKPINDDQLLDAVTEAINQSKQASEFFTFLQKLTDTEKKIAMLISQGFLSKQIADILRTSTRTVEWHRSNIGKKGGLPNYYLSNN